MWPSVSRLEWEVRFDLGVQEALEECEAVARTLHRWVVEDVDVAGGRIEAVRRSRLGFVDRVTVWVGESVRVEVRGRAPRWRLERTLRRYLREVGEAMEKRRDGREAGS